MRRPAFDRASVPPEKAQGQGVAALRLLSARTFRVMPVDLPEPATAHQTEPESLAQAIAEPT
jgi:hypothetical protein